MKYLPDSFPSDQLDSIETRRLEHFYEQFVVKRFNRYGFGHFALACYAALPAVLTADLVHKIWLNFKKYTVQGYDLNIHPVAPADLLLSPLVEEIGFELYQMAEPIRQALLLHLQRLSEDDEAGQIQFFPLKDIAAFLLDYARQDRKLNQQGDDEFWEAQEWTALSYLDPSAALAKVGTAFSKVTVDPAKQLRAYDAIEKMTSRFELGIVNNKEQLPGDHQEIRLIVELMQKIILNREVQLLEYLQHTEDWKKLLADKSEEGHGVISIKIPETIEQNVNLPENKHTTRKVRVLVVAVSGITASSMKPVGEEENNGLLIQDLLENCVPADMLQLQVLLAEEATKAAILDTWKRMTEDAGVKDDLLFYISGNGAKYKDHCYVACADSQPLAKSKDYITWIKDEEIGMMARTVSCSSMTAIIQTDHAATPYWLDISKPGNLVLASSGYEENASTYKVKINGRRYCGFTYALAETFRKWEMHVSNSWLFTETLEAYNNPPEAIKPGGVSSLKTPKLLAHPATTERFFLQGSNIYVRLQNLLRHYGVYELAPVSGKWDQATGSALRNLAESQGLIFQTKQDSVRYLEQHVPLKENRERPIFLFVFCDFEQKLSALQKEKNDIRKIFEGVITETAIELQILENPDKKAFQEFFTNGRNRDRIHLFHFAGFGEPTAIHLSDDGLRTVEFLKLLEYQRNIRLTFFNACNTGMTASWATQLGVWNSISCGASISDEKAARFAVQFYQDWVIEGSAMPLAFQNALEGKEPPNESTIHRDAGRAVADSKSQEPLYRFQSAAWLPKSGKYMQFEDYKIRFRVFIHYNNESAKDTSFFKEIEKRVSILNDKEIIDSYWFTGTGESEDTVEIGLEHELGEIQVALLLISADYFFDDACYRLHEVVMKQKERNDLRIIPVLLRPVEITGTGIDDYPALPTAKEGPAFLSQWENPDAAYLHIELELKRLINQFKLDERQTPNVIVPPFAPFDGKSPEVDQVQKTEEKSPEVQIIGEGKQTIYALLVGINDYQLPVPKLAGCVADVKAMDAYLRGLSDTTIHLKTLTDSMATKSRIVAGFREHLSKAGPDDVILFYYAGHGTQEAADEVFWSSQPARRLDALVCYDGIVEQSTQPRFTLNLLADKEFRYLLFELSRTGAHILTIFDCCFSGDHTRNPESQLTARHFMFQNQSDTAAPQRAWEKFIFSDVLPWEAFVNQSVDDLMPEGRTVHIAACDSSEMAFEQEENGVFTKALLEVLRRSEGNVSYYNLVSRLQSTIKNKARQTPRISAPYSEELFHNFLNIKDDKDLTLFDMVFRDKPLQGEVYFNRREKRWQFNKGAMYGVTETWEKESQQIVVRNASDKTALAIVKKVYPGFSIIEFDPYSDIIISERYEALVPSLLPNRLQLSLEGERKGIEFLNRTVSAELLADSGIAVVGKDQHPEFNLLAIDNHYRLTLPGDTRPLAKEISGYDDAGIKELLESLKKIKHWSFIRNLKNEIPATQLQPNALDISISWNNQLVVNEESGYVCQVTVENVTREGDLKLSITNNTDFQLFIGVVYAGALFDVSATFFWGGPNVRPLEAGKKVEKNFRTEMEPFIREFNWKEEVFYFQVIAAASEFELDMFEQEKGLESTRGVGLQKSAGQTQMPGDSALWRSWLLPIRLINPLHKS